MSRQISMPAQFPPVQLLAGATDAAGRTSNYVSLKNMLKAWIVCEVAQGNAAQVTFSPLQAQDVSGTNSKAVNSVPNWANEDCATSDSLVAQALAASYQTGAATKNKIVVFEIDPATALDIAGGFDCIGVSTSASNAGNVTSAQIYGLNRYQQATPPTALTN